MSMPLDCGAVSNGDVVGDVDKVESTPSWMSKSSVTLSLELVAARHDENVEKDAMRLMEDLACNAERIPARDMVISLAKYVPALNLDIQLDALDTAQWQDPWCRPVLTRRAEDLLEATDVTYDDVTCILTEYIRPIFQQQHRDKHSYGQRAASHLREWKDDTDMPAWTRTEPNSHGHIPIGCHNVLAWLISQLNRLTSSSSSSLAPLPGLTSAAKEPLRTSREWDQVWPLVLPPVITWLDTPNPREKILGACIAQRLIRFAPPALLVRTGIDRLLRESVSRMLSFMTDAHRGPLVLCTAMQGRLALISRLPMDHQFDAQASLFSDAVLTALSSCAPASSSTQALLPVDSTRTATLSSPRLQQALAYTACTCAQSLLCRMGEPSLRFWNAWMDWACAWLEHALGAVHAPFPVPSAHACPARPVSDMVDEIIEHGHLKSDSHGPRSAVSDWVDAGRVLLHSLHACVQATQTLVEYATDATVVDTPLPTHAPGLRVWMPRLMAAACKCSIRLQDLDIQEPPVVHTRASTLLASLQTLCYTILRTDDSFYTVRMCLAREDDLLYERAPPSLYTY